MTEWHLFKMVMILATIACVSGQRTVNMEIPFERNATNIKPYSIKITKYVCVGTPYKRTSVSYCKTVVQRNKPAVLNVSVVVPEALNYIWLKVKLLYKFTTYQPFLIDMEQEGCEYIRNRPIIPLADYVYEIMQKTVPDLTTACPHGNKTYNIVWWLEERYTPRSVPAGNYRLDIQFFARDKVLLFAVETYLTVRRAGPFLIDGGTNACAFMRKPKNDPVCNYIYKVMEEMAPDEATPCPLVMVQFRNVLYSLGVLLWMSQGPYADNGFNYEEHKNFTRAFKIEVQRLVCIDMPYKETILLECRMVFRRNQRLLSISYKLPKLYTFVMVEFRLHYKFTTYQTFLIDGKAEGCAYMREEKNDPILSYMYGVFKDMLPTIIHKCPYGNRTYTEMTMLKEEYAPRSIPAGDYRMDLRFSTKPNVTMLSLQLFFGVRRKGILNSMLEW
uniref:Uncharacterized protein n=1 Tax=Anopheles christyi TaxID=43041 RepID=A0A182JZC8_9DIPT